MKSADPPPANGRELAVGLAVSAGRLGLRAGRIVFLPARVVARSRLVAPLVRRPTESLSTTGREAEVEARRRMEQLAEEALAAPEATRAVDRMLAGSLPVDVGRSLAERRVIERVVAEVVARADLDAALSAALADPRTERLLVEALESRLTVELAERMVQSPDFQRVLAEAVSSPAVSTALRRQTASLGEELADGLRGRAVRVDGAIERAPRRWFRRPPRPEAALGSPASDLPYAGVGTRGLALTVDALLVNLVFLVGTAMIALIGSLFGDLGPTWLGAALAAAGWLVLVVCYFVGFWTGAGQTPGMRLLGLRLLGPDGAPPGVGRSALRLVGLGVAIAILFLGFLPALVDDRRRALQDFLARTVVVYGEYAGLAVAADADASPLTAPAAEPRGGGSPPPAPPAA
jgi:uncharacterized RDD family membrane protein YckC